MILPADCRPAMQFMKTLEVRQLFNSILVEFLGLVMDITYYWSFVESYLQSQLFSIRVLFKFNYNNTSSIYLIVSACFTVGGRLIVNCTSHCYKRWKATYWIKCKPNTLFMIYGILIYLASMVLQ